MSEIVISGPVAYLSGSKSAVYFSKTSNDAGTFKASSGTAAPIRKLQNLLNIAYWGEDNRFPNNIEQQMAYCGVGKAGLEWKAKMLWGSGIIAGKVTGYADADGTKETFQVLDRSQYKNVYDFIESRSFYRFMLEYLLDWAWYYNCFPEIILSKDGKSITGLVHQESCDCRFKQMNDAGVMDTVFLSKFWGASADQFAKFDPTKAIRGLLTNPTTPDLIPKEFIKTLDCIDMYDPVESLKAIAQKQVDAVGLDGYKSAILPVNYPSVNKTYYQVPAWDGARLAGWVEIAAKVPSIIKALFTKAFAIKYHIEIPETYFEQKYGYEVWHGYDQAVQEKAKKDLLKMMEDFLTGSDNAYKSFISFFQIDPTKGTEIGRVKITPIEDKTTLEKELVTSSAADIQLLVSMGINPTLFGAGTIGTGQQRSGGSDIRESWLTFTASLQLERQVLLEPLYLVRDYNGWDSDITFRFRDTVLTTLDQGTGTVKKVS